MKIVLENQDSTVMSTFTPSERNDRSYQSEAQLEEEFINILQSQGYEYAHIHNEKDLIANLRVQIEKLNDYHFSNDEWERFFKENIANSTDDIANKTDTIQRDNVKILKKDDGVDKNITIIDKENIHKNIVQVINQYAVNANNNDANGPARSNRYDVTVLVNGLPMVHIELKRRGVPIREAFNQINRYARDSFWAGSGLFGYVQIFVISNGTETKYYSNSTRNNAYNEQKSKGSSKSTTSNSFEFTNYWSDAQNTIISDLCDFAKTFFAKHVILNILTKYCVFNAEDCLMVMRPYQITAAENIVNRVKYMFANASKTPASERQKGGYVWHTTGSGKTLTSFKTSQLVKALKDAEGKNLVDKVLFVVDRKDLDYQTMREYDRFEKGAANSNTSTAVLTKQLEDNTEECRLIITTIQKLSRFINNNPSHEIYKKRIVFIFDECHRSQFGGMHADIVKHFKNALLFGFTGTPIFEANAAGSDATHLSTTEQTFGPCLHTYTIINAINDKNVLPFRVEYVATVKTSSELEKATDELVKDINRPDVIRHKDRVHNVVQYIIEHFTQKTYRNEKTYKYKRIINVKELAADKHNTVEPEKSSESVDVNGFNSIFAVADIPLAKAYYNEFKKQQQNLPPSERLKVATIFSYAVNEGESDSSAYANGMGSLGEENSESTANLDANSQEFLESAIKDYNEMFNTAYDTSNDKFQNYYKDVSIRMKNKEIDVLIVVNMFLTGFDATTLNTLWVDKNLRMHGLIQAFSRTNRILNSVKTFGNIVCFRDLSYRVDEAVSLFGDKDAQGIVLCPTFEQIYNGYVDAKGIERCGYSDLVNELMEKYPLQGFNIVGEENQKKFISLFGNILRLRNMLKAFDQFEGNEIIKERDMQDYLGHYQDLHEEWKRKEQKGDIANITDDVVFEMELVRQVEVNIDYILMLVERYHSKHCKDKNVLASIRVAVDSSPQLRSKKKLIEGFIAQLNEKELGKLVDSEGNITVYDSNGNKLSIVDCWSEYVEQKYNHDLAQLVQSEGLNDSLTRKFMEKSFSAGEVSELGTDINDLMPRMSRFGAAAIVRAEKKSRIVESMRNMFNEFVGLIGFSQYDSQKD
ncbi:type I restriction endonuclease subunit R [Gardnerella vaginalis]|uniref:type I restriction endonuclease subunit R n=1 Tax=Gardnerella vaginalis TaxID=2702 RepID=UPI00020D65D4|nr:type I restriction endonuclease subunit R [Gardnerella vaginalis]EGL13098.1 type I site-specific deoxyribonuclease, HsdR family [Gardnerella vaginalis 315-A]